MTLIKGKLQALPRWRALLIVGATFLPGCRQVGSSLDGGQAQPATAPRLLWAFRHSSMLTDRGRIAAPSPSAVGSSLIDKTLASDDSSLVEITPAGGLHTLKPGRTVIRATGNPGQA